MKGKKSRHDGRLSEEDVVCDSKPKIEAFAYHL